MKWETRETKPTPARTVLESGPIQISITESNYEQDARWQHCMISFGWSATNDLEKCQRQFPALAIAKAREALYEFEKSLRMGESK